MNNGKGRRILAVFRNKDGEPIVWVEGPASQKKQIVEQAAVSLAEYREQLKAVGNPAHAAHYKLHINWVKEPEPAKPQTAQNKEDEDD